MPTHAYTNIVTCTNTHINTLTKTLPSAVWRWPLSPHVFIRATHQCQQGRALAASLPRDSSMHSSPHCPLHRLCMPKSAIISLCKDADFSWCWLFMTEEPGDRRAMVRILLTHILKSSSCFSLHAPLIAPYCCYYLQKLPQRSLTSTKYIYTIDAAQCGLRSIADRQARP